MVFMIGPQSDNFGFGFKTQTMKPTVEKLRCRLFYCLHELIPKLNKYLDIEERTNFLFVFSDENM